MSLITEYSPPSTIAYGIKNDAPIMAKEIKHLKSGASYARYIDGKKAGQVNLSVQGYLILQLTCWCNWALRSVFRSY